MPNPPLCCPWVQAAYVAGTVLVLMRERGVRFEDGISVLVHSEVPEGKGVSSSAAVEVASMTALAAAFQVHVQPEDLAVLCQMVGPQTLRDDVGFAVAKSFSLLNYCCFCNESNQLILC